jgi:hypothetical protein
MVAVASTPRGMSRVGCDTGRQPAGGAACEPRLPAARPQGGYRVKRVWPRRLIAAAALALAVPFACAPAAAQVPRSTPRPPIFSGTNITRTHAVVLGVDPRRNSVMLWQDDGDPVEVNVDRKLGNVRHLQMGDEVEITYSRALLLRADKPGAVRKQIDREVTSHASPGSSLAMHRIEAEATVLQVDRARRRITLRGPTQTVTLQASSVRVLDGLKEGDSVRVDFVEATAIHITRDGAPLQ